VARPGGVGAPAGYPETPSVPTAQQPLTYVQGAAGILGHGERADRFGSVIATDAVDGRYGPATLVVGIPKEDIGRKTNAGAVGAADVHERGADRQRPALAGSRPAGEVPEGRPAVPGSHGGVVPTSSRAWHQDSRGIKGAAEAGDVFGEAVGVTRP